MTKPKKRDRKQDSALLLHDAFADAYVNNSFSAKKAALALGLGRTDAATRKLGSRLARNPDVRKRIRKRMARAGAKAQAVIRRWARLAFAVDPADFEPFLMGKAKLKDLRAAGVDTRFIRGISFHPDGKVRRIDFQDSIHALKVLTRLFGLEQLQEASAEGHVVEQTVNVSLENTLALLHERINKLQVEGIDPPVGMLASPVGGPPSPVGGSRRDGPE